MTRLQGDGEIDLGVQHDRTSVNATVRAPHREGDLPRAANLYEQAVRALPLAEYAIALGDVYTKLGNTDAARAQYDLVEAIDAELLKAQPKRRRAG